MPRSPNAVSGQAWAIERGQSSSIWIPAGSVHLLKLSFSNSCLAGLTVTAPRSLGNPWRGTLFGSHLGETGELQTAWGGGQIIALYLRDQTPLKSQPGLLGKGFLQLPRGARHELIKSLICPVPV